MRPFLHTARPALEKRTRWSAIRRNRARWCEPWTICSTPLRINKINTTWVAFCFSRYHFSTPHFNHYYYSALLSRSACAFALVFFFPLYSINANTANCHLSTHIGRRTKDACSRSMSQDCLYIKGWLMSLGWSTFRRRINQSVTPHTHQRN